jgi:hypothetical protein
MPMKYNEKNKPLVCMQTNSHCYKNTRTMEVKGILWHSTGANNPTLKRYVQPSDDAPDREYWLKLLGKNKYGNDWNHIFRQAGMNCWIGKLEDGTVTTVQTMPWNYRPWGCGSGKKGSCNNTHIQFEICEDSMYDKKYFEKAYREACEITAYLCKMFNLDPHGTTITNGVKTPVILCHYDSYHLGLGNNHGDIYSWFEKHGKDMDDVRNDVAAIMKESDESTSNNFTPPPVVNTTPSASPANPSETSKNIKKDDIVKISSDAHYYTGKQAPAWVTNKTWVVKSVKGNRIVIDKSEDGKHSICSPFDSKYLTVVKSATSDDVPPTSAFEPYLIRVTAEALNIRRGAGTNYKIVKTTTKDNIYTIVDEAMGEGATKWGLLKSYQNKRNGWISLDYVKKIKR